MTIAFHLLQLSCQTVFYLAGLFCQTVSYLLGQSRQIVCYLTEPSDNKCLRDFSSCTNIFLCCYRSKLLLILIPKLCQIQVLGVRIRHMDCPIGLFTSSSLIMMKRRTYRTLILTSCLKLYVPVRTITEPQ